MSELRELPETPETFYLIDLMASNDFQESLKNYLDLEELRKKLEVWSGDLVAFEDIIEQRRAYYQPLLPAIDREFRRLDSKMRLRMEQRDRIEQRLQAILVAPRPDLPVRPPRSGLSAERIAQLEKAMSTRGGAAIPDEIKGRIRRLRGVLDWNIYTEYDERLTRRTKIFGN